MPATRKKTRSEKGDDLAAEATVAGSRVTDAPGDGTPPVKPAPGRPGAKPARVKAGEAAARIRGLAALSESLESRRRLRRLGKLVAHGSRNVRRIAFIEAMLGECLDEAQAGGADRECWLTCEAVVWGLAWLARTRRAGGSAGGLLERVVKHARAACQDLRMRETISASFVVSLARLFRDIEACRCLEPEAAGALSEEIGRLVSKDGAVALAGQPFGSAAVVERVERWSAAREIAEATGGPALWDKPTEDRWRLAAEATLRLLGGSGRTLAASRRRSAASSRHVLAALLERKNRAGRTAAVVRRPRRRIGARVAKRLLPRDLHAADSALAIIRTGWHRDALRVLVDYRESTPRLEIATHDRLLVDGPWSWRASVSGRPLEAEGPWTVSGFESDRKATFLEITAPLGGGLQLERQVVVLVRDAIVLLADAIVAPTPPAGEALVIESAVPLGQALEAEQADETREIVVYDTAMRLMALPLALGEWAAAAAPGGVEVSHGRIVLRQESHGGRLYAPLWLDCDPTRIGRPLTWRQLTVADTRRNLPRHQAAGFRVQAGLEQWLLYRSLDAPRNRTVLGCNLSCEFLLGRIRDDGVVARTVEIAEAGATAPA